MLADNKALLLEIVNGLYTSTLKRGMGSDLFSRRLRLPHFINAVYVKSYFGCKAISWLKLSLDDGKSWKEPDGCTGGMARFEQPFDDLAEGRAFNAFWLEGKTWLTADMAVEFQLGKDGGQPVVAGKNLVLAEPLQPGDILQLRLLKQ